MTIDEIKKLDRKIQEIPYPFGENYPVFHKLFKEFAEQHHIPAVEIMQQYSAWKYSKK